MKELIYLFVFFQLIVKMSAQPFVDVNDPVLSQFFCDTYPDAMVNNCTQIDLSKQEFISDTINLDDKNVKDISPLLELSNVLWLELDGNSFDTIIGDFSKLVNLNQLDISLNRRLSKFPDFSTISSPTFEYLVINRMGLDDQPNLSSVKNSIIEIEMKANEKYDIQDFSDFPKLEVVNLHSNHLTFYDLKPLLSDTIHPTYYRVFPQQKLTVVTNDVEAYREGDNFEVHLSETQLDEDNVYYWFKDNVLISMTDNPFFVIPILTEDDEGTYFGSIKNPAYPNLNDTLIIETFELKVDRDQFCLDLVNSMVNVESTCDDHQILLDIEDKEGLNYYLKDVVTQKLNQGDGYTFANLEEGDYLLIVENSLGCSVEFKEEIRLETKKDCDQVLSPNGDGIGDSYYIEQEGTVIVINKFGEELVTLEGPVVWNGRGSTGEILNSGYYLLVFKNGESINITIER